MATRKKVKPVTEAEKEYFKRVGARLKYYRLLRGHTNYETFANLYDIPRSTYGKYELGRNITLLSLNRILDVLEIEYEEFHRGLNK
jgi:transcriptional regulator with XRE-family HTH domain